jgi:hypothetical protein
MLKMKAGYYWFKKEGQKSFRNIVYIDTKNRIVRYGYMGLISLDNLHGTFVYIGRPDTKEAKRNLIYVKKYLNVQRINYFKEN